MNVLEYLLIHHEKKSIFGICVKNEDSFHSVFGNFTAHLALHQISYAEIKNSTELTHIVERESPDLIYFIQFSLIVGADILKKYWGKIVNLHNSYLPFYRGMSPISHAIRNGEKFFGVTLHLVDEGIDTGPIIGQKKFNIENHTNFQVYHQCEKIGFSLIKKYHLKIVKEIKEKKTAIEISKPQDNKKATYFGKGSFSYQEKKINFNQSSKQVYQEYLTYTFPPILYPEIIIDEMIHTIIMMEPDYLNTSYDSLQKPHIVRKLSHQYFKVSTRDCWVKIKVIKNE